MEAPGHELPSHSPNSSFASINGGSPGAAQSSSSPSLQVQEDVHDHHQHDNHQEQQEQQQQSVPYNVNISISDWDWNNRRDDAWSCLVVLVTFWFFASMALILGYYGSVNIYLGPNCSRLLRIDSFLVNYIKVQELSNLKHGTMLYGFYSPPPLDVEITWSETHNASIPANFHKEWVYFLNEGSHVDISYNVKSQSSPPLSLVIAQGKESLLEWIEDPSYPNTTLSWNVIHGIGTIQQKIIKSSTYYVAVGNLNLDEVEVQLNLTIQAFVYNTTEAYYKCSLTHDLCGLKLFFMRENFAILTSPSLKQGTPSVDGFVKLSYGPRWITYFVGYGGMIVFFILALKICNIFQASSGSGTRFQTEETGSQRTPLLSQKDDDILSWGSSYDSVSHDEEEIEDWLAVSSLDQKSLKDSENDNSPQQLCVICFDAPRDCFFLPCGHCAACFTCGTRIVEETGTCPICCRKMKKVRKIFTV